MTRVNNSMGTIIKALQIAFFVLLCFFAVKALMVWLNPNSVWKTPVSAAPIGSSPVIPIADKKIDFKFDPFHRDIVRLNFEEPVDTGEDAPETTLNLTLTGLISGENGRVTIKTANNKQSSYGIGDEITDGVTLKSIFGDYIVLSRGGKTERLTFERDENSLSEKPANKTSATSTGSSPVRASPGGMSAEQLLSALSFQKVSNKKNRVLGYKISSAPNIDLKRFGFRDGDIVSKIGGKDLTKQGIDLQRTIMEAVASGNSTAQVTRRGRKMTVRVKLP